MRKAVNAAQNGTTMYLKTVRTSPVLPTKSTGLRVLKSAANNSKLSGKRGGGITRGRKYYRGRSLYQLTLVERETCPETCGQWEVCYGNKMPFARRYTPGVELEEALEHDLNFLQKKHPEGFVVRLHVLGDFYSTGYVAFWRKQLHRNPNLALYGYTHRKHGSQIGNAVASLVKDFPERTSFLRSEGRNGEDPLPSARVRKEEDPSLLICPEQTGKTESCMTCGLCFNGNTNIHFLEH